jgi:type II secretion system protein D
MKPILSSLLALALLGAVPLLHAQDTPVVETAPSGPVSDDLVENLNFPNNPASDLLDIYEKLSGKRIIRDANLAGINLSVVVNEPISKADAMHLIEGALLLNGFVLVDSDKKTLKVLNTSAAKSPRSEGVALYAKASELPKGEVVASYFMPFQFLNVADASTILQQHVQLHPYGSIVAVPGAQALVITENAPLIHKMIELKQLIDVPPAKVSTEFITLKRANAERVAELVTRLLENRRSGSSQPVQRPPNQPQQQGQPGQPQVGVVSGDGGLITGDAQILADPRTNRILLITRPINVKYIRTLIEEFDKDVSLMNPFERPLRFIAAKEVLPVLVDLLRETEEESGRTGAPRPGQQQIQQPPRPPTQSQSGRATGSVADQLSEPDTDVAPESQVVGKTRLIADKRANSILVMGPPESVEKVRLMLDTLDRRPLQVYLSTVIGQLTLGKDRELAVDLLQKFSRDSGTAAGSINRLGSTADTRVNPTSLITSSAFPAAAGLTVYGALGQTLNYYVKALESSNRFKVLSRPVVYTANNKKAVISSGQKIAVPTSTISNVNDSDSTAVTSNIEYQDVVLKLEVIPLINADREVTLQIAQVNDSIVGSQTIAGNTVPTIGTQEVRTTVTIPNQATVLLGGLITESLEENNSGIPILKDIPLLGHLFKSDIKNKDRSELIIMIQPQVIESVEEMMQTSGSEQNRQELGRDSFDLSAPEKKKKPVTPPAPRGL